MNKISDHYHNNRYLWLILFITFVSHSIVALIPPIQGDEAYFWEWSRHLAFGYYSHPPMTGWLIALVTAIFDVSKYTVRLTSIFLHLITICYVYQLAIETTKNKNIANASIVILALMPLSLIFGTGITTDSSLITFYTMAVYYSRKAIVMDDKKSWYWAAFCCGGMLLTKFMAVLFFPGIFLFILLNPRYRFFFLRKEPYLAFVIAFLIFLPFLIWNAQNEWLTFQFNFFIRHEERLLSWKKPFIYIFGQMLAVAPIFFLILIDYLTRKFIFLTKDTNTLRHRYQQQSASLLFISYSAGFPLLFYLLLSPKVEIGAHWAAIVYPAASVLIACWFFSNNNYLNSRLLKPKTYASGIISAFLILMILIWVMAFPKTVIPDKYIYTKSVNHDQPPLSHYYGWEEIGQHIANLESEWTKKPEGFFFTTKDYSLSSTLSFYTPTHPELYLMNFPKDGIHGKDFLIWEKGKKKLGANTIYITDSRNSYQNRISAFFEKTEEMPPFIVKDDNGRILRIFYLTIGYNYLGGEPDNLSIF